MLSDETLISHNYTTHHPHYDPHITALKNASISKLSSFSGLILTIVLIVLALMRLYVFETLMPRIYRKTWPLLLEETQRRNFVNHHVAAMLKITMVASQIYPLLGIAFGDLTLHSPLSKHSQVTTGDIMIVGLEIFVAMYVFELFYRVRVSYISTLHHVCAAVIAQSAVAIGIDYIHQNDATYEFIICFIWGMFDVIAELWPHFALILYRVYPERHYFLAWVFRATVACELVGTTLETALILWFFGALWHKWELAYKIVTPTLHLVFTAAQLWGAWVFWQIAKKEYRKHREEAVAASEEGSLYIRTEAMDASTSDIGEKVVF